MAAKDFSFVNKGSDAVMSEYCCSSCEEGGTSIDAEFYCGQCVKFYCLGCIKLHRQLFKTHAVSGREDMERWHLPRETQNLLEKCDVHNDKKLELFCGNHKQLCCITCISSSHRGCKQVSLISEKSQSQDDFPQTLSDIKIILDQLIKRIERSKESIQSLNSFYEERLQEIRDMRERLNAALDKLEKTTLEEIGNVLTSLNAPIKVDINTCTKFLDEMKIFSETIQGKKNKELRFIAQVKSIEKLKQAHVFLLGNSGNLRNGVSFQANKDIEIYLNKQHALGLATTIQLQNPDQVITVQQKERFKLKMAGTSRGSFDIAGICGLPRGAMIAADNNNNKLLLLDEKYHVVSHCQVPGPYDVCMISKCEVAVTVDYGLQFVSVNTGQLVKGRKFRLEHTCVGIAHFQDSLYVTSYTALYHYNCSGQLIGMLYEDTSGGSTAPFLRLNKEKGTSSLFLIQAQ